jgi:hypothetical protein
MMRSPDPADTPKLTDTGITVMAHAWGFPSTQTTLNVCAPRLNARK